MGQEKFRYTVIEALWFRLSSIHENKAKEVHIIHNVCKVSTA